ncbi:hypothetical protein OF83DRAFT_429288 [Amylostereum chailletii]|nr:hypothetical protein OF83DRAFT_429288 [Amylostereum chailletii]
MYSMYSVFHTTDLMLLVLYYLSRCFGECQSLFLMPCMPRAFTEKIPGRLAASSSRTSTLAWPGYKPHVSDGLVHHGDCSTSGPSSSPQRSY